MANDDHTIDRWMREAKKADEAEQRAIEIVERVLDIANKLSDWKKVGISDSHYILNPTATIKAQTGIQIEAMDWPNIQEIHTALEDYRQAANMLRSATSALSHDDRNAVHNLPQAKHLR